jgi:hypothetical protein
VSYLQNCNGDTLGFTNEFIKELDAIKPLWKADNSLCDFEYKLGYSTYQLVFALSNGL